LGGGPRSKFWSRHFKGKGGKKRKHSGGATSTFMWTRRQKSTVSVAPVTDVNHYCRQSHFNYVKVSKGFVCSIKRRRKGKPLSDSEMVGKEMIGGYLKTRTLDQEADPLIRGDDCGWELQGGGRLTSN